MGQSLQKRNKIKIEIFTAIALMQYLCILLFFPDSILKLKARHQPQNASGENLLTRNMT